MYSSPLAPLCGPCRKSFKWLHGFLLLGAWDWMQLVVKLKKKKKITFGSVAFPVSWVTQLAILVWILNYGVDCLMLCLEIWSRHKCTAPSGFENSSLVLKTVAKTTMWCCIVPQLHWFSAVELVFPELWSRKTTSLPVILRGEWGFCGRNAQKYLTTEWMDLVSDLYADFSGFLVSEVSEIEQGLGWEKKPPGKTPNFLKKLFRKKMK